MPIPIFKQAEAQALDYRVGSNLWGELKYSLINSTYLDKYRGFLDIFLSHRSTTFHSWSFDSKFKHLDPSVSPNDLLYRNTYMLIRSVVVKYQRHVMRYHPGNTLEFVIMIDESGDKGLSSAKQFQEFLANDNYIDAAITQISFLSTCSSTINNSMQTVDILTGLTASYYSNNRIGMPKIVLRDHVAKQYNNGVMLHKVRNGTLPDLFNYKIHAYLLSKNQSHIRAASALID